MIFLIYRYLCAWSYL